MYAVVELKYDKGKLLLAKKVWLLKQQKVYNKTEDVFCYWSPDLNDSVEDIQSEYFQKFTGEPGLFKVFVIKLAGKSNVRVALLIPDMNKFSGFQTNVFCQNFNFPRLKSLLVLNARIGYCGIVSNAP